MCAWTQSYVQAQYIHTRVYTYIPTFSDKEGDAVSAVQVFQSYTEEVQLSRGGSFEGASASSQIQNKVWHGIQWHALLAVLYYSR